MIYSGSYVPGSCDHSHGSKDDINVADPIVQDLVHHTQKYVFCEVFVFDVR